ncbi:hypothetical protein EYF80_021463 [Liparis tanakae]|uniref:Uncharacterized protein n=1 Tax=Liparis tanakae TaxID=230148 RepID=A0A4Z2HRP0_9TELE|nr:hypothetical protein EYF80_021463 [Liparis tanakae]
MTSGYPLSFFADPYFRFLSAGCTVQIGFRPGPDKNMNRQADAYGAFTPKVKLFVSPKTRGFTRSTIHRVLAMSIETLHEGRGLSLCVVSVKTVIIFFIHQNN